MANGLFNLKQVVQAVQQGGWPAQKTPAVEYLVVAGGGSGGGCTSGTSGMGGGGAGGLLMGIDPVPNGQTLLVTVGAGGTGSTSAGATGSNSVFGAISASGGGGGGSFGGAGVAGGSGGGSSGDGIRFGAQGVVNQGNAGGTSTNNSGGGGGGAGTIGLNSGGTTGPGGNGGAGIGSSLIGTVTTYSGGGGGAYYSGSSTTTGQGGVGGGGLAGYVGSTNGTAGTANTGGGGGGGCGNSASGTGGNGGSGVVIVSYPDVYAAATATTGSPTVSTSGSGSIYFNGSSYFRYAGQTPFAFGSGDWTIEFWINLTSSAASYSVIDFRAGEGAYPTLYMSSGKIKYYVSSADRITSTTTITANTWFHIAVCRTGTSTKMYINGVQEGSTYTDGTTYLVGASAPVIGGTDPMTGYMSNVRMVKGVCVYTGNFTSPIAPLQATQPAGTNIAAITSTSTSLLLNANSGAFLADNSTNGFTQASTTGTLAWNALSPFTITGYKNRVYRWTSSGSITF